MVTTAATVLGGATKLSFVSVRCLSEIHHRRGGETFVWCGALRRSRLRHEERHARAVGCDGAGHEECAHFGRALRRQDGSPI